jgi:hypothetical protein
VEPKVLVNTLPRTLCISIVINCEKATKFECLERLLSLKRQPISVVQCCVCVSSVFLTLVSESKVGEI